MKKALNSGGQKSCPGLSCGRFCPVPSEQLDIVMDKVLQPLGPGLGGPPQSSAEAPQVPETLSTGWLPLSIMSSSLSTVVISLYCLHASPLDMLCLTGLGEVSVSPSPR